MISPTDEQVKAGQIARGAVSLGIELCQASHQGVRGLHLDKEIETYIRDHGGIPALKGYQPSFSHKPYEHTICLSLNKEVVHGTPNKDVYTTDLITIDLVVNVGGWHADMARTFVTSAPCLSSATEDKDKYDLCNKSIMIFKGALATIGPNQPIALFGACVEATSAYANYTPIKEYCGHGIGEKIHIAPQILNYNGQQPEVFEVGKSYAVEPVLAAKPVYKLDHSHPDGWTVLADCFCSHFEDTIFVTENGIINLTGK